MHTLYLRTHYKDTGVLRSWFCNFQQLNKNCILGICYPELISSFCLLIFLVNDNVSDDNAHPGRFQPGSVPTRPDVLRSILRIYKHPPGCQLVKKLWHCHGYIDGSVKDCSISSTLTMEIFHNYHFHHFVHLAISNLVG